MSSLPDNSNTEEPKTLAEWACFYASLGFEVFPVNPLTKTPLISQHQSTIDAAQIKQWWEEWPNAAVAHRLAPDELILDIDPRHNGHDVWKALREETPKFSTRTHYSGRGDGGGHVWFRRPAGRLSIAGLTKWAEAHGVGEKVEDSDRWSSGIDLLTREHRYSILPPSPHMDTAKPYYWAPSRDYTHQVIEMPELLRDLLVVKEMPAPQLQPSSSSIDRVLSNQGESIADWYSETASWRDLLSRHGWTLIDGDGDLDGSKWRHPTATSEFSATIKYGQLFVYSPNTAFDPTAPGDVHGYTLFRALAVLEHRGDLKAAGRAARESKGPTKPLLNAKPMQSNANVLHIDPKTGDTSLRTVDEQAKNEHKRSRILDGASFIFDEPDDVPAIWGEGEQVLWSEGETLLINGPAGVGKTTIAQQVVIARLGLGSSEGVLSLPVVQEKQKLLYIAADRPRQIARSLKRMVRKSDHQALADRLIVWRGPLPFDIGKDPEGLVALCKELGAGTVVIDSLKDVAVKLKDDEAGSGVNMSLQNCLADGIECMVIHHQRKQQQGGGAPKTLADVYGSIWITAGVGSVLVVWGEAGDSVVEISHLKQPAETVGPLKVQHNHYEGSSCVVDEVKPLDVLRSSPRGISARFLAVRLTGIESPEKKDVEKARRRLEALVRQGKARVQESTQNNEMTLYFAVVI